MGSWGLLFGSRSKNLVAAAIRGEAAVVRVLLAMGAPVNTRDTYGNTTLMLASLRGRLDVVQALLDRGADVNAKRQDGMTALRWASEKDHIDVARALLGKQPDAATQVDAETKQRLLYQFTIHGGADIVRLLLDAGADPNSGDGRRLSDAAEHDQFDVVKMLLEKGANPNLGLYSTLCWSVRKNRADIAKLLLEKGANVNARFMGSDPDGATALWFAAENGSEAIIQLLLKNGADVNTRARSGAKLKAALVDRTAEYLARGKHTVGEQSALSVAKERGNMAAVNLLEQAGASE